MSHTSPPTSTESSRNATSQKPQNPITITQLIPGNISYHYSSYMSLLQQLTDAPELSYDRFRDVFLEMMRRGVVVYLALLGPTRGEKASDDDSTPETSKQNYQVIGAASILIEQKLIKNACRVAHLEDVVVDKQQRGNGIGKMLLEQCKTRAKEEGCFKMILDCGDRNVPFYEKCGFVKSGIEMKCEF